MTHLIPIRLPQINVNDESAQIIEWIKTNGERIEYNEAICVVETTKSVVEIPSPAEGYLTIVLPKDERAETGQIIAAVSSAPITQEELAGWLTTQSTERTAEKKWTTKAEILAKRHGVDLDKIGAGKERITEADVRNYLQSSERQSRPEPLENDLMDGRYPSGRSQRLLILGGGNGAIQIADAVFKIPGQRMAAILDDNSSLHGKHIAGIPITGPVDKNMALAMYHAGAFDAAVISVSTSTDFRARVYEEWTQAGIPFANIVHPTVDLGANVAIGTGNILLSFCHVGACATIGNNSFFSPYCSIEHHSIVGDHCSFGPGVVTSSRVRIGNQVRFGTGIFIEPGVAIGAHSIIGSGSVIVENIAERLVLKTRISYVKRQR
jgi:sugar O-acyltransferase (sialic acid O-acetyltransferase NeuD family)